MRKLLLAVAAALMAATFVVPANAGGLFFFPLDLCKEGKKPFQLQCASNNFSAADNSSQQIKQRQGGKAKGKFTIKGLLQSQEGSNLKLFGDGGTQNIKQSQYAKLKNTKADGRWSPVQKQDADNLNFGGSGDQSVTQKQVLIAKNADLEGTQQSQSATNTILGGEGNSQTIKQSQSFEFEGEYKTYGGGYGCFGFGCDD